MPSSQLRKVISALPQSVESSEVVATESAWTETIVNFPILLLDACSPDRMHELVQENNLKIASALVSGLDEKAWSALFEEKAIPSISISAYQYPII